MTSYVVVDSRGTVVRSGEASSIELAEMQAFNPGETAILDTTGEIGDVVIDRIVQPRLPQVLIVTLNDVKREQRRRLTYTDSYITRAADPTDGRPIPADVLAQRKAIREAAARIEAMDPIPPDYRDERHWTEPN